MVGMYAAGTTYEVTGKGFDPEARALQFPGKIREATVPKGMWKIEEHEPEFHGNCKCKRININLLRGKSTIFFAVSAATCCDDLVEPT